MRITFPEPIESERKKTVKTVKIRAAFFSDGAEGFGDSEEIINSIFGYGRRAKVETLTFCHPSLSVLRSLLSFVSF